MGKNHFKNLLQRGLKIILKILPPSFPSRFYRIASKFPPFKAITNTIIRSFIPPYIQITEGIVALNQEDVTVCGALALGAFEKRELEIFRNVVKTRMNVVDIGANIGLYTVIASHRIGPDGKIFAYEPEKENFVILTKNIALNQRHNCVSLQMALSEKIEKRNLYLAEDNKGHHSFAKDSSANIPVSVLTDTLDHSLEKYGSPKIDIIKMDIEGAEPLALKGMKQTINQNPDIIIFTEIYPNAIRRLEQDPLDFLISLAGFGLSIWVIDEDIREPTQLKPEDFPSYIEHFPKGESFHNLYASKKLFTYAPK